VILPISLPGKGLAFSSAITHFAVLNAKAAEIAEKRRVFQAGYARGSRCLVYSPQAGD